MGILKEQHFIKKLVLNVHLLGTIAAPNVLNGHIVRYLTSPNVLMSGQDYHEVVYKCDAGYKMSDTMQGHMFCQQGGWIGLEPYCEVDPDAKITDGPRGKEQFKPKNVNRCTVNSVQYFQVGREVWVMLPEG